jgi:phosphate-selective porin
VIPSGAQVGFAGELRVPIEDFDLTGEFVSVNYRTREGLEGSPASTLRRGALTGYGYYGQLGWWPLGNRDIAGIPGGYAPTHVDFNKPTPSTPPQALQFVVKWEQLHAKYDGASREGEPDPKSPLDGDTKVNAISVGANYWATKHVRLTANYVYNMFPSSAPAGSQTSDQRAQAPANKLSAGINDSARTDAHALHELLFRAAVAF